MIPLKSHFPLINDMSRSAGGLHSSAHGKHWDISNHLSLRDTRWEFKKKETLNSSVTTREPHFFTVWSTFCKSFPARSLNSVCGFCLPSGVNMEMLGRRALWEVGLNYGHGTGHGVGNFFGVHECMLSFFSPTCFPFLIYSVQWFVWSTVQIILTVVTVI